MLHPNINIVHPIIKIEMLDSTGFEEKREILVYLITIFFSLNI